MMPGVVAGFPRAPLVVPSAPVNFEQSSWGSDPLLYYVFSWQPPQSGSPPLGYRIYMRSGTGGYVLRAETTGTSGRVNNISVAVALYFYVTAWNSAGESQPSNVLAIMPN